MTTISHYSLHQADKVDFCFLISRIKTGIDKCLLSACSQQGAAQRPQVCSGALAWSHLLEQKPQLALRLAHPLAEAVGSLPHEERHLPVAVAALVGQRSGDQRLPRPRRTVKQTTSETDGRRCSVKVQRRIMFYLFCLRNAAQSFMRWVININIMSHIWTIHFCSSACTWCYEEFRRAATNNYFYCR